MCEDAQHASLEDIFCAVQYHQGHSLDQTFAMVIFRTAEACHKKAREPEMRWLPKTPFGLHLGQDQNTVRIIMNLIQAAWQSDTTKSFRQSTGG